MSLLGRGLGRLLRGGDVCPGWGGREYFSKQRGKGSRKKNGIGQGQGLNGQQAAWPRSCGKWLQMLGGAPASSADFSHWLH